MLLNDIGRKYFVDDLPAPTTTHKREKMGDATFENTKQYFSLKSVATGTVNLFDLDSYNANRAFYDTNFTVNSGQTYESLLNEIVTNGYKVWWMKINWSLNNPNSPLMKQSVIKVQKDANGEFVDDPMPLTQIIDIYQSNLNLINIDMKYAPMILDGVNYMQFTYGDIPIELIFFYDRVRKGDLLRNKTLSDKLTEF